MRRLLSRVVFSLFLLAVLSVLAGWVQLQRYLDTPLNITGDGVEYSLPKGGTLGTVAYSLAHEGVLIHPKWLTIYSRISGRGNAIHAGDYLLTPGVTPRTLLDKLESGDVRYFEVTLVEGWTVFQVLQRLRANEKITRLVEGEQVAPELLGEAGRESLEGMFYPDTYRFQTGASDLSILRQALQRMQSVLAEEWATRDPELPYRNPYEALIMASLVEKETGYAPEREQIAGVFVRRLQRGMRLQTDPAVIYGLGPEFDGNLRTKHLKDESNRYNTYRHNGLTPTPIALAGRAAIHAALHPAKGSALYFVAKGDGSHYFSDTLEQHQRAVRKYQIEQRQKNYSSSPPPGAVVPDTMPINNRPG